ncbi:MAG: radical SAM/SPASM domain-containing protein [Bacillota bacterium]|nr:radical SAM/SPASM domain-containing protein [Bacillota bacterium]
MFSKAYVEITNICNLNCSFCHGTKRAPRRMSTEEFSLVVERLKGHTRHIYFHLMGEPLTHPDLPELLHIAALQDMNCCITTNGFLLEKCRETLKNAERLYKISVSLHSFEANPSSLSLEEYLECVWKTIVPLAERGTICALRLWNDGGENSMNGEILEFLKSKARGEWQETRTGSLRLEENIYLENAARFEWPDINAPEYGVQFCHGLRDQLAVLCDGTVVPCCLDAEGEINLGNIFKQSPEEILSSDRAKTLYRGFSERKPTEELCRRCGYAARFNK